MLLIDFLLTDIIKIFHSKIEFVKTTKKQIQIQKDIDFFSKIRHLKDDEEMSNLIFNLLKQRFFLKRKIENEYQSKSTYSRI